MSPLFSVLTQNVYLGADLQKIFEASSLIEAIDAAREAWSCAVTSNIPARAKKIAEEIAASKPDLVALQETIQWYCGNPGNMSLQYDFLETILISLNELGVRYVPLAINGNIDQALPVNSSGELARLVDRDAVLFRVSPPSEVQPYNIQSRTFSTLLPLPTLGSSRVPRGWIAVDAFVGHHRFRLIESHLESLVAEVQVAQAKELITGPASGELPVIIAGDLNSNAHQDPDLPNFTSTYGDLLSAGFHDVWTAVNPDDPGCTAVQAPDLRNPASLLNRRIDLILAHGEVTPIAAQLVASTSAARTASGLWPSDHAGVLATLRLGPG